MNHRKDLTELVVDTGGFPAELVEEVETPASFDLTRIHRGLAMVLARWSPFPLLCLRRMKGLVPPRIAAAGAKLYLFDNDKLPADAMQRLFGSQLHGGAETFAIVGGGIRGELKGCPPGYEEAVVRLCSLLSDTPDIASGGNQD